MSESNVTGVQQDPFLERIRRSTTEELFTIVMGRTPAWQKTMKICRDYGVSKRMLYELSKRGVYTRRMEKGKAYWDELQIWLHRTRKNPTTHSDYVGTHFVTYSRVVQLDNESTEKAQFRLQKQVEGLRAWCSSNGIGIHEELSEISSSIESDLIPGLINNIYSGSVGCVIIEDVTRLGAAFYEIALRACSLKNIPLRTVHSTFTTECRLEAREDLADLILWYRSRGLA